MSGYYISVNVRTADATQIRKLVTDICLSEGCSDLGDVAASVAVEDEDALPPGDAWFGVLVSGAAGTGWVSVYADDWPDSGLLAKRLSASANLPVIEVWVAEDVHWGYTYYENGEVQDRFASDPTRVAETPDEAALYAGDADVLAPILRVPPARLTTLLREAQANAGQFAGGPLDALAEAIGIPFEHSFTGYDYFFADDPEDYAQDLEDWPAFRHLAFAPPPGRESLAE